MLKHLRCNRLVTVLKILNAAFKFHKAAEEILLVPSILQEFDY